MIQPAAQPLAYRAEIDGLRAVAVLAVVLFHAHLGVLRGGYAGVDVFFVISGFLISRLIAQEVEHSGRFSLAGFYERRIRRLFPALTVVVAATLAVGWFQLPPVELTQLARSAFAALAFFSNLHFAKQAGYFQPQAESQPLLHTWSLGVEEQFYILAPFVILGLLRLPQALRRAVLAGLMAASLGAAVFFALRQSDAAFFWPHTRAYELLAGVALGLRLIPLPRGEGARGGMALVGLGLVGAALMALPPGIAFPSFWALLPCAGAMLVIGASEGGIVPGAAGALLRAAPMRFFGKISYSLYLWHWPVLVYADLAGEGGLSLPLRLAMIVLAIALAWLSYRFVETPLRHGQARWRVLQVFGPAALVILAGFAASSLTARFGGFPARLGAFAAPLAAMHEPATPALRCAEGRACTIGAPEGPLSVLIWGDSHIGMVLPAFEAALRAKGQRGEVIFAGGCPPLVDQAGRAALDNRKCHDTARKALALVEANPGLRVVLVGRWAFYAEGTRYGEEEVAQQARALVKGDASAHHAAFAARFASTLAMLAARKADVRIIGPVPEFPFDVLQRASRALMRGQMPDLSVPRADFAARQRAVFPVLAGAGVPVFAAHQGLCDASRCIATQDGVPLYGDSNHLSARGSSLITPIILRALD
ncbi:MAG: acyltransferase [Proteobacteria bacterium]|nr:acyltransferase [Pseudomonadota bacterium]